MKYKMAVSKLYLPLILLLSCGGSVVNEPHDSGLRLYEIRNSEDAGQDVDTAGELLVNDSCKIDATDERCFH